MGDTGVNDNISFAQLRAVVAVGRVGSFTRAGDILRISQSAVSKAVASVEETLGVTLLNRTTRTVHLTRAGEEFVRGATRVLAEMEAASDAVKDANKRSPKSFTVSCSVSVAGAYLARALDMFESRDEKIGIQCHEEMQYGIENRVVSGHASIGICNLLDVHPSLSTRVLWTERYHLCVPRHHRLARQSFVRFDQVYDEEFISIANPVRPDLDPLLAATGQVRTPRITVTQYTTAFRLIEAGRGLAMIPCAATMYTPPTLACPVLGDESLRRVIGVIWSRGTKVPAIAENFLDDVLRARIEVGCHQ